ncbi:hypothetical protein F5Y06DRAFT_188816 [Hypoxylon sp. FL0890]|nr:hypothetical protein F5Y06DRAFT_188816 [Hypoxylon sp. FL0890]
MGRTEPSVGRPPASFRRDARSKRAKATANKVIPAVLAAHPRARRGVEASELIVDPPPYSHDLVIQKHPKTGRASKQENCSGEGNRDINNRGKRNVRVPRISLHVADTLAAAYPLLLVSAPSSPESEDRRDLSNTMARVGVLNMASPLSAGGGFLNGAQGQEEASLCARTTLFPALRDEFYRIPELGVVFTPDVLVFRDVNRDSQGKKSRRVRKEEKEDAKAEEENEETKEEARGGHDEDEVLPKRDRWFVDVVSAAMLRLPEIDVDAGSGWATYTNPRDRELAVRKMRAVLRVFAAKGVKRIVLGAWGCGAYGNPVGEIARAWKKVLLGGGKDGNTNRGGQGKGKKGIKEKAADSWEGIEQVVFAIKDAGMARAFATAFGEDLLERYDEDEEYLSEDDEDGDIEDVKVKELRTKIQELELRVEQARTPQLRSGLNSVLVGLRSQLSESGASPTLHKHINHNSRGEMSEGEEDDDESTEDLDELEDRNGHDSESKYLKS